MEIAQIKQVMLETMYKNFQEQRQNSYLHRR